MPSDGYPTVPVYRPELSVKHEGPQGRGSFCEHARPVDNLPFSRDFIRTGLGRSSATGLIAFYVAGRTMEPTLAHGDLVPVDTAQHLSGPGICVAASEITFLMARANGSVAKPSLSGRRSRQAAGLRRNIL